MYLTARTPRPLTDPACRTTKPREREYKLFDCENLYLLVRPYDRKSSPYGSWPGVSELLRSVRWIEDGSERNLEWRGASLVGVRSDSSCFDEIAQCPHG